MLLTCRLSALSVRVRGAGHSIHRQQQPCGIAAYGTIDARRNAVRTDGAHAWLKCHRIRGDNMAAAKRPTAKQYPWLCDRGRDERAHRKYLRQVGPGFRTGRYATRCAEAVFRCNRCGQYCVLPVSVVKAGRQRTCGCLRRIAKRKHPVLVDTRSIVRTAHLKQVGKAFRVHGDIAHAVFQCSCKNRKILRVQNVTRGTTVSCGCALADTSVMRLIVELRYFEQLRKCGIPVDLECMNREAIAEQLKSLHSVLGYRKASQAVGLQDNALGWKDGNIEWQSRRKIMAGRQVQIMAQMTSEVERFPKSVRLEEVVRRCGECPSPYHELSRINPLKGRTIDNMQWLLPSPEFIELVAMESAMIERASRARKNIVANVECQFCFSKRTRVVSNKSKRGYRQHRCHDCEKSFRVPIGEHVTGSHQIDSDAQGAM